MITKSAIARPLLAVAAALVSTQLAAREPVVVTGHFAEPVHQQQVSFADLDLRQSRARQALFSRVMQASAKVCLQTEGRMNMNRVLGGAENTCPNRTYRVARPQVLAALRRARNGQPHPATALTISVPALVR